ncbi:hypothetical protein ACQY0O_005011 [Thecaphora frezii]
MEVEDYEGDSCRICRGGAEVDQPLYHPCKCTGSIRYCHQDCLVEWLQHSRKKYCELCNHPFLFLKRYRRDMPEEGMLPAHLYLRRAFQRSHYLLRMAARALLVAFTWLAVLPWININLWRLLFWSTDVLAWVAVLEMGPPFAFDRSAPAWNSPGSNATALRASTNSTLAATAAAAASAASNSSLPTPRSVPASAPGLGRGFRRLLSIANLRSFGKQLAHDCFEGQILTCVIVVFFMAIFLLREWILQNFPQAFDDADHELDDIAQQQRRENAAAAPALVQIPIEAPPTVATNREADAEAQAQAQARQAASALRLAQLQDTLSDAANAERREMLVRILEEAQMAPEAQKVDPSTDGQDAVKQEQGVMVAGEEGADEKEEEDRGSRLDADDQPKTADELRRLRLRRFQQIMPQELGHASSSDRAPSPLEPVAGPSHHIEPGIDGASVEIEEHGDATSRPLRGEPSRTTRAAMTSESEARWPLWDDASEGSSSKRHSMFMSDGNAISLSVPSWREGSMSPAALPNEPEGDEDVWNFSPSSSSARKGKGRAIDTPAPQGAGRSQSSAGADAGTETDRGGESTLSDSSSRTRVAPASADSDAPEINRGPEPGRPAAEAEDRLEDARPAQADDRDPAANNEAGQADNHVAAALVPVLPLRDVLGAAAANDDPVAEALLEGVAAAAADGQDLPGRRRNGEDNNDGEDDFDNDAGFLEELDGLIEAIGMRGPLFGILQNLLLMVVLCSFVMMIVVMLPYLVGKALGPGTRLLRIAELPIRLLRYVTDPVFDAIIGFTRRKAWPLVARVVSSLATEAALSVSGSGSLAAATTAEPFAATPGLVSAASAFFGGSRSALGSQSVSDSGSWKLLSLAPLASLDAGVIARLQADLWTAIATGVVRPFEALVDVLLEAVQSLDARTLGSSSSDRAFCVVLGHVYWLLALGIQKWIAKSASPHPALEESAFRVIVEQHLLIIKVICFLLIELVVFPLGCGLLLDVCLMPIFDGPTIFNWLDRLREAPFAFTFLRWIGGTVYMFVFAQYVSTTRSILRPGVLCWIRDPNDPGFHPIRDILGKTSLSQLRRIGASGVMYAGIAIAAVGANTYFLRYALGSAGVLPLRWKPMDPISEVPADLLLAHLVLPWLCDKIDADAAFANGLKWWWRSASRMFRLSTYMIGGEFPEERGRHIAKTWRAWILGERAAPVAANTDEPTEGKADAGGTSGGGDKADAEVVFVPDGGFCRVPGDDKAITSGPLLIPVDADGSALDERGAEAIYDQEEADKKKTPRPTYTVMYMPPRYRLRITALLTLLWLTHCTATMLAVSVPLVLGRRCFAILADRSGGRVQREPHDFYPFCLGAALLGCVAWCIKATTKLYRRAKVRALLSNRLPRVVAPWIFVAISLLRRAARLGQAAALGLGLGLVVPLLVGLTIHQYIIVSLRWDSGTVPEVDLWQTWATGLIQCKLLLMLVRTRAELGQGALRSLLEGLDAIQVSGLRRPQLWLGYRRVVVPVSLACLGLLLGPAATADLALRLSERLRDGAATVTAPAAEVTAKREQAVLRIVYGAVLFLVALWQLRRLAKKRMEAWTDLLKDEVFLVSTELRNYEPPRPGPNAAPAASANTAAEKADRVQRLDDAAETKQTPSSNAHDTAAGGTSAADSHDGVANGRGTEADRFEAEGPLPDVLLR